MKSERRHELKTNELADWVGHLPGWARQNRNVLIYLAIVLIAAGVFYYLKYRPMDTASRLEAETATTALSQLGFATAQILQGQAKGLDASDLILQVAANIETAAAGVKNPPIAALALIKRAQALRIEMHYMSKNPAEEIFVYQIKQAGKLYAEAMEKASGNATLTAMAQFGTGLCAEELGNFDEAEAIYNEIATNPDFAGTTFPAQAKLRASSLDDYKGKVFFAKAAPAPAPVRLGPAETDIIVPLRPVDEIVD